jgi:hypothetical protein
MAKISVCRKRNWMIGLKMFEVFLDEQRIGYLMNGETAEYEVSAGPHKLKVKMGRQGSNDFNFNLFNNEAKSFSVSQNYKLFLIAAIVIPMIIIFEYYQRTLKLDHIYSMVPFVIFMLLAVYFQTIGKNTYFKIKEELK